MLYVTLKGNKDLAILPRTVEWHKGETLRVAPYEVEGVKSVQADGDELDWIAMGFGNTIPLHTNNHVQAWYGDIAKSIVFSLIK